MTWRCKFVEYTKERDALKVGDMFYGPAKEEMQLRGKYTLWVYMQCRFLSEHYWANNSHRRPLFVVLPGQHLFCIDGQEWNSGRHWGGWTVTGEVPDITVSPSINIGGLYHGWLKDGVLSDDVEGRVYGPDERQGG